MIKSERINIVPFEMKYLNHYFSGFNAKITKFQWPDPFESIEDARSMLQDFLNEMDREETLLFSILSKDDDFAVLQPRWRSFWTKPYDNSKIGFGCELGEGLIYVKTGSILCCIIGHCGYNMLFYFIMVYPHI